MSGKVRKTLTLDPDIVAALGDDPASLSTAINEILREEVERREMHAALGRFVDKLEAETGSADPELVEYYKNLMAR